MIDKINEVIGKPFDAVNFHCYHLVRYLVPKAPDWRVVASIAEGLRWSSELTKLTKRVTTPESGDIALLGRTFKTMYHAGVYFEGRIVHVDSVGTRAELLHIIARKYPAIRYYRCI